ncbi:4-alpha-glucanotransferase [Deinococcus deserti]|uniref:4-alpha-glucanotransferase n=1 Tax=Deinococcus deserti (strain DSM 17065 / CIP 109153 / LMG 22923 / VCD115) TaxID=546414 RepID=C1CWV2_DEIDV|nr:4-alpha-glucanotransferase [Deinococcus deserti]ACO46669.1 putative 4-alpha-glucanotransferase (Dextrin glycosyltransferase) [Deinococcus deserti VCD115]
MTIPRSSGVLLHPTSLPGPYGIGELGTQARHFIDWLAAAGQHYWQVMPLGPTGYGDSPYQAFSAFAGNPYLIDLTTLREEGLLGDADFAALPAFNPDKVDFGLQYVWRNQMLERAHAAFLGGKASHLRAELEAFIQAEASWLDDYALFTALKDAHGGLPWNAWPSAVRDRQPEALATARASLSESLERVRFIQFLFFRQWTAIREYARGKGIQVIGDIPIFVAMDSSDAWANREQFYFDDQGQPTVVAGVPPDYFSETGQLWGNPLYNWDAMRQSGYQWWIDRFQGSLKLYDVIRIDHFRGFAGYWEIPFPAETAVHGRWVPAPGHEMFAAVRGALGNLPIIAEDLGVITPDVEQLRDDFEFPGMAVLQFAFGGGDFSVNDFLPHNLRENQVVYTGTHDNDTTRGWWRHADDQEKHNFRTYTSSNPTEESFAWELMRLAFESRANLAVVPLQDIMNLGTEARMNLPGTTGEHNWTWRYRGPDLRPDLAQRLRELTDRTGRL